MAKKITTKEAKFIAFYMAVGSHTYENASQAALSAGYSPKSAPTIGYQLLKKPKIQTEIEAIKDKEREKLPKERFVSLAMKDYEQLDVTEPNKPRFLDLAGKALGYIGANNDQKQGGNTLNLTQINISGTEDQGKLWDMTRKMLGDL